MNVNFNNLRAQAVYAYNRLTIKLNEEINNPDNDGEICINPQYIQRDMDDLRQCLVAISCVYEPDNNDFADISNEVEQNGGWETFNKDSS